MIANVLAFFFLVLLFLYNILMEVVSWFRFLPVEIKSEYKIPPSPSVCYLLYSKGHISYPVYEKERHIAQTGSAIAYLGYLAKVWPVLILLKHTSMFDIIAARIVRKLWLNKFTEVSFEYAVFKAAKEPAYVRSQNLGEALMKLKELGRIAYQKGYMFLMAPAVLISMIYMQFTASPLLHLSSVTLFLVTALVLEKSLGTIEVKKLKRNSAFYDIVIYTTAIASIILFWSFVMNVAINELSLVQTFAIGLNIAVVNGIVAYIVGHELGHRKGAVAQQLSDALIMNMSQYSFKKMHNVGHHRDVATSNDLLTAKRDESLGKYLYKVITKMYSRARDIDMNTYLGLIYTQVLMVIVAAAAGGYVWVFFILQFVISLLFLETINYIQHYGISKSEEYSSDTSWDCTNTLTNGFLFNIGQHAHHHRNAQVKFYNLESVSKYRVTEGYLELMILAMQPKKWFKVMNARIDAVA